MHLVGMRTHTGPFQNKRTEIIIMWCVSYYTLQNNGILGGLWDWQHAGIQMYNDGTVHICECINLQIRHSLGKDTKVIVLAGRK